jgi:hypothetical protein
MSRVRILFLPVRTLNGAGIPESITLELQVLLAKIGLQMSDLRSGELDKAKGRGMVLFDKWTDSSTYLYIRLKCLESDICKGREVRLNGHITMQKNGISSGG